ncbi:hypothetical protein Nepgr_009042 [Nepenthes gracilis]|uniref:Uncharacterized protein n=1 Tax=Nepenthes gracilis TaxID=150966 RepID=A0AAD3SAR2_NEPGR|nr:hypothetical protein Nepgr_009042 [Nepenthes gracilis]
MPNGRVHIWQSGQMLMTTQWSGSFARFAAQVAKWAKCQVWAFCWDGKLAACERRCMYAFARFSASGRNADLA